MWEPLNSRDPHSRGEAAAIEKVEPRVRREGLCFAIVLQTIRIVL